MTTSARGANCLAVVNPALAAEGDGTWDPTLVTYGSNQKVGWRCAKGHLWEAAVCNRSQGTGCPFCSGRRAIVGETDLTTVNPELATECDGTWNPRELSAMSSKKVGWRCAKGHLWEAAICDRTRGDGCPFCSGRRAVTGETDLATVSSELAAEGDGTWDPTLVTYGSSQKVGWRCAKGHLWEAAICDRTRGNGCPFCAGHRVVTGETDLATTNPALAAEGDGTWDPRLVTFGSSKRVGWRCVKGHLWEAPVCTRSQGNGCPYCAGKRVIAGESDLATTNPRLATEGDGTWDPRRVNSGSQKKVGWVCGRGHHWVAQIKNRVTGHRCPYCTGKFAIEGETDLATVNPELAAEGDGTWGPQLYTPMSGRSVGWRCKEGHSWSAIISNRSHGAGCPYCTGQYLIPGETDLATVNPKLAAEGDGTWDPKLVTCGSSKNKVGWRCMKGHQWTATVDSRTRGNGCPSCATTGFNPSKPAWLYLMHHQRFGLFQIGISNVIGGRIKHHTRTGFELVDVRGPLDGYLIRSWETSLKSYIAGIRDSSRKIPAKIKLSQRAHASGLGSKEVWYEDELLVGSLRELMELVQDKQGPLAVLGSATDSGALV